MCSNKCSKKRMWTLKFSSNNCWNIQTFISVVPSCTGDGYSPPIGASGEVFGNTRANHSTGQRILNPSPTHFIFADNFTYVVTVLRGKAKLHHLEFNFAYIDSITLILTGSERQVQYFSSFLLHMGFQS